MRAAFDGACCWRTETVWSSSRKHVIPRNTESVVTRHLTSVARTILVCPPGLATFGLVCLYEAAENEGGARRFGNQSPNILICHRVCYRYHTPSTDSTRRAVPFPDVCIRSLHALWPAWLTANEASLRNRNRASTTLVMAASQRKQWIALICLALNGLILTVLCVGWQVQHIAFHHEVVLLGCTAASTLLCLLRLVMDFLYEHKSSPPGLRRSESVLNAIEVCTLGFLIGFLYTSETAKECLRGKESVAARVCRIVVGEAFNTGLRPVSRN